MQKEYKTTKQREFAMELGFDIVLPISMERASYSKSNGGALTGVA